MSEATLTTTTINFSTRDSQNGPIHLEASLTVRYGPHLFLGLSDNGRGEGYEIITNIHIFWNGQGQLVAEVESEANLDTDEAGSLITLYDPDRDRSND